VTKISQHNVQIRLFIHAVEIMSIFDVRHNTKYCVSARFDVTQHLLTDLLLDLRFWRQWRWRVLSAGLWRRAGNFL